MSIKNYSDKLTSLKTMTAAMPSDVWDLDNLIKYSLYADISIIPQTNLLDDYREYFEKGGYITEVEVDDAYFYSPAAFADYYYGSPKLDWLVLYFAKIPSFMEFTSKKITVLTVDRLTEINKIIVHSMSESEDSKNNPDVYNVIY